jgi:hypothetical protein
MKDSYKIFLKTALISGTIFGTILVLYDLILWMLNIMPVGLGRIFLLFLINLMIYIFGGFWFTRSYRNGELDGFIKYGHAYLFGLTLFVFTTIILAVYSYIFNKFIDPEYTARFIHATKNWTEEFMSSRGLPESEINKALDKINEQGIPSAFVSAKKALFSGLIVSAICSLISSAFAKKVEDPFKESQI